MIRATLIDLNSDEYNQGFSQYLFMVNLDRCNGIYNAFDNASSKICVPNKIEDVNLSVFNIITRTNQKHQ